MLRKVFLQTQFGAPHPWTEQYLRDFQLLAPYGWELKVFTPNHGFRSEGNVAIVSMTIHDFDGLIEKHCGVNPENFIHNGAPHKLVSDYYPAYGHIFQDFIKGVDFWGFTNWDMVYGRLDRFIPDAELEKYNIWSDDPRAINGIFSLFRNDERVNNLFRAVADWGRSFTIHEPCAFDEHQMTRLCQQLEEADADELRWGYPRYFGLHSYDRLPQHRPTPNLYREADGGLIERFEEPQANPPGSARKGFFGREIMSFHFSRTKRWPL